MKTTKYIFNLKTLLVFITSVVMIACSNNDDEVSQGPSYDTTPGKAVLTLPLNNEPCEIGELRDNNARVTFTWDASEATERYDLEIINLETGETINRLNLPETTKEVTLPRGYPYSWKIISKNSGEATTVSDTWKFYISGEGESNSVPFPATLLSPSSGAKVAPVNGVVTLEWESSDPDGDEVTYTVFADTVDGNQDPPEAMQNISDSSVNIEVEPGTIYYWHIETSDGENTSISVTYTFVTTE